MWLWLPFLKAAQSGFFSLYCLACFTGAFFCPNFHSNQFWSFQRAFFIPFRSFSPSQQAFFNSIRCLACYQFSVLFSNNLRCFSLTKFGAFSNSFRCFFLAVFVFQIQNLDFILFGLTLSVVRCTLVVLCNTRFLRVCLAWLWLVLLKWFFLTVL